METKRQEEKVKAPEKRIQSLEKGYYTIIIVNILSLCSAIATLIAIVLSK